ncbi:MAG: hypothetical protein ACKN9T_07585 [Candidatus Methylumidiphilus sp.]
MDHDQSFKNLILDYPAQALEFFANVQDLAEAVITPVREEQLQEKLGSHYRRLDVPLQVEWPDGRRAGVVFVVEEETEPKNFSIHRLIHYCVDLAELLDTTQIVPVVVFLRGGRFPHDLHLGDGAETYLSFRFMYCQLSRLPAEQYLNSGNIVARLNLPNMRHKKSQRLAVYHHAVEGLQNLEPNSHRQQKYIDFIDAYADLSDGEVAQYRAEYLNETGDKTMGLAATLRQEGRQEGIQTGMERGIQTGEAALLLRLMTLRFGPLADNLRERVQAADADTLLVWGERILTAATAEEVVRE